MSDDTNGSTGLTLTNGALWLATQPPQDVPTQRSAFTAISRVPMHATAVRKASALARAVTDAMKDVEAARIALCEQYGTRRADGTGYDLTDLAAWQAGFSALLAEDVTLPNVVPMKISDFVAGASITLEDVDRCGPLLTD